MRTTVNDVGIGYADEGHGVPLLFVQGFPPSRAYMAEASRRASSRPCRVIAPDLPWGTAEKSRKSATKGAPSPWRSAPMTFAALALRRTQGPGSVVLDRSLHGRLRIVRLAASISGDGQRPACWSVPGQARIPREAAAPDAAPRRRKCKRKASRSLSEAMASKMPAAQRRTITIGPWRSRCAQSWRWTSKPEGVIGALLGMARATRCDRGNGWNFRRGLLVITRRGRLLIPASESEKLAQAIAGSQLKIVPHAGHLVAFEQADKFNHIRRSG